jgi:hypothetical protein
MLQQFITKTDSLPENDPNYLYKEIVVGSPATIDRRQQDGIIEHFWQKMQGSRRNSKTIATATTGYITI